jgi:hypothetical protein
MIALAGMLGGAMVGLSTVDGLGATGPGSPGGTGKVAAASPTAGQPKNSSSAPAHSGSSSPPPTLKSSTPPPTLRSVAAPPSGSPKGAPTTSPKALAPSSPKASPTAGPKSPAPSPTAGPKSPAPSPTAGPKSPAASPKPTPLPGSNNRNPNWKHDSQGWNQWDGAYQDPTWRSEHSRDSRHENGFFNGDRDHFCDRHNCDRFHTDEFQNEDRDFRHDCDVLLSIHSVRALLDFLDSDVSLRDFFELHGDLFDFLVHHSDQFDEFDSNCTFIIIHG